MDNICISFRPSGILLEEQAKIGMKAGIPKNANNEAGILQKKGSLFFLLYSFMFFMAH